MYAAEAALCRSVGLLTHLEPDRSLHLGFKLGTELRAGRNSVFSGMGIKVGISSVTAYKLLGSQQLWTFSMALQALLWRQS
jgi:hypothetical protein